MKMRRKSLNTYINLNTEYRTPNTCIRSKLLIAVTLSLTGCVVGPDFTPPPPPSTQSYTEDPTPLKTVETDAPGGTAQSFLKERDIPAEWWRLFKSEALNKLICRALKNSPTLQAAQAALLQAEGNLRMASSSLFPAISLGPSAQRQRSSGAGYGPFNSFPASTYNLYNAPINATYTLDAFGGIQRQIETTQAQLDSQKFQIEATFLTLTSNIVTTAIAEAALRGQIEATKKLIDLQAKTLHIIEEKLQIGAISKADLLAQQTQLERVKVSLLSLEKALSQTRNGLAILIGELPSEANLPTFTLEDLHLPTELPLSLPSHLVRQRPDVRVAEELLHAASAQIGVAVAGYFPQVTLTGNFGWYAGVLQGFFDKDNMIWSLMATITQPIFQGGALEAKEDIAKAAFAQAWGQYRLAVLQAFQNVADTLNAIDLDAQQFYLQTQTKKAAWETFLVVKQQYALGSTSYLDLLDAERQYIEAQMACIQTQANRYSDTAALYQALGGGWWNRQQTCIKK
jgi:NodT family efflux transporter outer membrane factor (OMF) lipoprotein